MFKFLPINVSQRQKTVSDSWTPKNRTRSEGSPWLNYLLGSELLGLLFPYPNSHHQVDSSMVTLKNSVRVPLDLKMFRVLF